jgi:hypothetical protein
MMEDCKCKIVKLMNCSYYFRWIYRTVKEIKLGNGFNRMPECQSSPSLKWYTLPFGKANHQKTKGTPIE